MKPNPIANSANRSKSHAIPTAMTTHSPKKKPRDDNEKNAPVARKKNGADWNWSDNANWKKAEIDGETVSASTGIVRRMVAFFRTKLATS